MVTYDLVYTKRSQKEAKKIAKAGFKGRVSRLLDILSKDPYQNPPPYKRLVGVYAGAYSRRINIRHRLVYQVYDELKVVKILSMWKHYDD